MGGFNILPEWDTIDSWKYHGYIWYDSAHTTTIRVIKLQLDLHSGMTPHTLPSRASHGVSFTSYTNKNDLYISRAHRNVQRSIHGHGCDGVSSWDCSAGRRYMGRVCTWWRHQMEAFSALLALCAGKSPVNSPHRGQWRKALIFKKKKKKKLNQKLATFAWRLEHG